MTVTVKKDDTLEKLRKYRLRSWKAAKELQGINNAEDIMFFYTTLAGTKDPEVWFNDRIKTLQSFTISFSKLPKYSGKRRIWLILLHRGELSIATLAKIKMVFCIHTANEWSIRH